MTEKKQEATNDEQEKSFFQIVVHSFFIIPFLIAVFCVLLFAGMHLLTREKRSVYDYLEDVKTGGLSKRWQGAFELSKILSNPKLLPKEDRFYNELVSAFKHAKHDDNRVRQYLALAMGRTGRAEFVQPLIDELKEAKEANLASMIYAVGMLKSSQNAAVLHEYVEHPNARIRSIAVVSLGNIGNPLSKPVIKLGLNDSEPNVQWGAAVSLAKMGDLSGKYVLINLLDRTYLAQFPEVDSGEKTQLMISAIKASTKFKDKDIFNRIRSLSKSDKNMKVRSAALEALQN